MSIRRLCLKASRTGSILGEYISLRWRREIRRHDLFAYGVKLLLLQAPNRACSLSNIYCMRNRSLQGLLHVLVVPRPWKLRMRVVYQFLRLLIWNSCRTSREGAKPTSFARLPYPYIGWYTHRVRSATSPVDVVVYQGTLPDSTDSVVRTQISNKLWARRRCMRLSRVSEFGPGFYTLLLFATSPSFEPRYQLSCGRAQQVRHAGPAT